MFRKPCQIAGISALALACANRPAAADFKDLIGRVPTGANVIMLIDVEKLLSSPLAAKEGWKDQQADTYSDKPLIIPPSATRVVMAAMLDPLSMQTAWEISIMDVNKDPNVEAIAAMERGFVETLSGKQAAWSPINAYFVQLDSRVLGAVAPANRQFAARWARLGGATGTAFVPEYLKKAATEVGSENQVVLALDLGEAVSPHKVRARLRNEEFASLAGKKIDADAFGQLMGSLKGMTLKISVGQEVSGKIAVEFGRDAAAMSAVGKPLLLEILARSGADIPEFSKWPFKVQGMTLAAEGKLSSGSLKRILSIIDPPVPMRDSGNAAPGGQTEGGSGGPSQSLANAAAAASQKYFKTVFGILDTISKDATHAPSMGQLGTWLRRDARRINRLPILNVDTDLLKWGADVSARMGAAANLFASSGYNAQSRTAGVQEGFYQPTQNQATGMYNNDEAYTSANNAARQRLQAGYDEQANATKAAGQIISGLSTESAQIRAQMTQKYNVEF